MEKKLHLLLADDDEDECFFFESALKELTIPTTLSTFENGEKLLDYLYATNGKSTDVLFLDINMPRIKGPECLKIMKSDREIKDFPVIIYSTCVSETMAGLLYEYGAHYCMQKCDLPDLIKHLQTVLMLLKENNFIRPLRDHFILNLQQA